MMFPKSFCTYRFIGQMINEDVKILERKPQQIILDSFLWGIFREREKKSQFV